MSADPGARRIFVGLALPGELARRSELLASSTLSAPGWRFQRGEDLHLTLCFLGWIGEVELAELPASLRAASESSPAFELVPGATGGFPGADRARVAWLAPEPCAPLVQLEARLRAALAHFLRPERRTEPAFGGTPHVTLARRAQGEVLALPRAFLEARVAGVWPVEQVRIYESIGERGPGPRYRVLESLPLFRGPARRT